MNRTLSVTSSFAATISRFPAGLVVSHLGPRPDKLLELYDIEASPFCRKVREALSILDLEAMIFPCPRKGNRFRPRASELGGKQQFPYFVDPNHDVRMFESDDIIAYLFRVYGDGSVPLSLRLGPLTTASEVMASLCRPGIGMFAKPSRAPEKPLELWSFEASPFCRLVREALCSLELPYRLHNVAKGSPSRQAFLARSGKMMVPFLHDPNTGVEMFESQDIVDYLGRTYGNA